MKDALRAALTALQIPLTDTMLETLCRFGEAVLEKNKVMNLTAITDPAEFAALHLADSLTLTKVADLAGKSVLDVGCGAGFPGVPLAITVPAAHLTALDSTSKRMDFLRETLPNLGVNAETICARAEDFCADHREQYDVVTSRAVARLNVLCELCLPFVKVGGVFLAMKGAAADEELSEAKSALAMLGGSLESSRTFPVGDALHRVLVIRKKSSSPARYPRPFARIKKTPL